MKKTVASVIGFLMVLAVAAHAEIVPVTGITGHDGGNWPSWYGHLTDMINGSDTTILDPGDGPTPGMDTSADPADPSAWTWSGNYQKTWHANSVLSGASNGKAGWAVLDFGSVVDNLGNAYVWASGGASVDEQVKDYNIYYSSGTGIDALPAMPQSKGTTGDYDFSSGDWTQIGSTNTLAQYSDGSVTNTLALGGVSAQYLGVEVMSLHGAGSRMAIGQVEVTSAGIPEPASAVLLMLGGLFVARRRRR